ncbi:MAG: hypothetical protein WCF94_00535 [bacterium]
MDKIKINEVVEVYFKAMLAGYFGEKSGEVTIEKINNKKTLTYKDGNFIVVDSYTDNFGTTEISWRGNTVWMMFYYGHYSTEAIPHLIAALKPQLENKIWLGGRGPKLVEMGKYFYENIVEANDPMEFRGMESITSLGLDDKPVVIGYHRYCGKAVEEFMER